MSLNYVRSVVVRFHPFNAFNGTARQFLAQANSPAYVRKYPSVEVKHEINYESNIEPEVEVVFENNAKRVIACKGLSMQDLFGEIAFVLQEIEQGALENQAENDEENPYLAMAKQQEEKLEAKRKKMIAMEKAK